MHGDFENNYDVNNNNNQVNHTIRISIPTLKKLKISLLFADECDEYCSDYKFIIQTPNLEYLTSDDYALAHFVIDEIPSLREAKVRNDCTIHIQNDEVTHEKAHRVMEMLIGIRNAKALTLSVGTTAALSYAFQDDLPTFPFLKRLEVLEIDHAHGWKFWSHFLPNSPILECLVLERKRMEILIEQLKDYNEEIKVEALPRWNQPQSVPCCLLQHLKEITMRSLWGLEDEVQLVKYLLENGHFLEKLCINFDDTAFAVDKDRIINFARGSDKCIIKFV
ncbi:hypothetical protein DITRI_Ditri17bG0005100 [Diplodiscus trichospermus]